MKQRWLRRAGAPDLIILCTGWAVGAAPFAALQGAADLLLLSDYRELSTPEIPQAAYRRVSLVAYSFGVAAACHLAADCPPLARKVAISGTATPLNATTGIPPAVFHQTERHLSTSGLRAFARRAECAVEEPADLDALRAELRAVAARPAASPPAFDRIWLGSRDRIFPPENLALAWQDQAARVRWRDCGHNPMPGFRHWDEVLA
ncbi:pimeloyl-ACP methyl esterase BioG family protein [Phaeovulum sp. W22_SRMD_FR3]|uniref:pimeloyl-ACP methyl esterase BioG family protein n=1 Tax=Phaeovulum sp. W22_SRMD_FR3 TaxID=3240274 RepID=UPI003F9A13A1